MKKTLYAITIFVCACFAINASSQEITGQVINTAGQPLEYVNIVLLQATDSTYIEGTTTRNDGTFMMAQPKVKAFMRISYIGYTTKTMDLRPNVGKIVMEEDTKLLGEVTVKAHRRIFEMGKEGMVTNVAGTPVSKAGTAENVLEYVPGITKTHEGLNVFGKGTPVIYINGRQIHDMSELDRLKSEDVKSVELIQNPGAQYDASTRAVIKIRTVRPAGEGFGMGLRSSLWQSENTDLTEQMDLTYYNKGLYAFGTYKFTKSDNIQNTQVEQTVVADTLWNQQNELRVDNSRNRHEITAGINYDINDKHSVGLKYIAAFTPYFASHTHTLTTMQANGKPFEKLDTDTRSADDTEPSHNVNAFYNGTIYGTNIDLNIDYLFSNNISNQTCHETSETYTRDVASQSKIRNSMFAAKLILGRQMLNGTFRIGIEAISSDRHDDYTISGTSIVADTYSRLRETQLNPFAEYQKTLSNGQLNLGLRYEHVAFKYDKNNIYDAEQSRTFDNLFPYISLGMKVGKTMLNLSYSVKTKRPTYRQLSSNVSYINHFSLQSGNPNLKSEHIHDISLMGVWKFVQFVCSWQDNRDAIIFWDEAVPSSSSITQLQYKNLTSLKSISTMVSVAPNIGIWSPQFTLGLRKQWLDLDTPRGSINLGKPMVQAGLDNSFSLPLGITANINMNYRSMGDYQNVHINRNSYTLGLSITKSFFNGALDLKVEGSDLLHLNKDGNHMYSHRMDINQRNSYDTRELGITMRYNFNVAKSKYKGTGAGNAEKARL